MYGDNAPIRNALKPMIKSHKVRKVGTASDVADAKEGHLRTVPSLFVIAMADAPLASNTDSCDEVLMEERFGIVYAVSNKDAARHDKDNQELNILRKEVRKIMKNTQPEGHWKPLEYKTGKLMFYNDTTLWWQDEFVTEYHD